MSSKKADNDDLKSIKSHLEHSLDLNNIQVSEELIQRTLQAVNKARTENQAEEKEVLTEQKSQFNKSSSKKVLLWNQYLRPVAGIAAALFVVVAGFYLLPYLGLHGMGKKSANMIMDSATAPKTSANDDKAKMDLNGGKSNFDQAYTASDSATTSESGTPEDGAADGLLGNSNIEPELSAGKSNEENSNKVISKISEIFFGTSYEIKYLRITNVTTSKEIVLTSRKSIEGFYSMMQQYTFTNSSDAPTKQLFLIEAKSSEPEGDVFNMVVGDTISISHKNKNSTGYSVFVADNPQLMIQNIADFYENNSK